MSFSAPLRHEGGTSGFCLVFSNKNCIESRGGFSDWLAGSEQLFVRWQVDLIKLLAFLFAPEKEHNWNEAATTSLVQATFKFSPYHGEESARTLCPGRTIFSIWLHFFFATTWCISSFLFNFNQKYLQKKPLSCKKNFLCFLQFLFFRKEEIFSCNQFQFTGR